MCAGLGPLYQDPRGDKLVVDLAAGETPVSTYIGDGFLFLQIMIDEGHLGVDRTLATLPNTEEETSYFSEGDCACINSICRAKVSFHNYPFNVEMTALPVLPGDVVCVVGADQRSATRYQIRTFRCILTPRTR